MRYFKRQGSEVIERMSTSRTATPNAMWSDEQLAAHGFTVVENATTELMDKCYAFDYTLFEGRMIQVIPQERWFQLSVSTGVAYTMNRLIEYPGRGLDNFQRFKAFVDGLQTASVLTADEVTAIKGLFLEQGIDLEAV
jgi:hypothetical protein